MGAGGQYRLVVATHALVATALSTAGADFRRWWGLALMGVVSTLVLLEPSAPPQPVTVTALAAAVALGVAGIAPRDMRVHPWGPVAVAESCR
jgi:hypothetical protein